jgi:hypothetical protein
MGSAALAEAASVEAEFSAGAAKRTEEKESCKAMRQQAATRMNSWIETGDLCRDNFRWKDNFDWAGANRMIFMNNSLPVQRYPKGLEP